MVVMRREALQRSRRQQALQVDCTQDVEARLLKATRLKQRHDACRDPAARTELARAAALAFDEYDAVRGHWALLQKQLKCPGGGGASIATAFSSSDDACALRCAAAARAQRREAAPAATQQQHTKLRQGYARSVRTRDRQRAERRAAAAEVSVERLRRELQRAAAADGGGDAGAAAASLVLRWNEGALARLAAGRAAAALRLLAKAEAATAEDLADDAFPPPRGAGQGGGRDVRLRLRSLTYNNYGCVFSAQRDGERALLCFELALGLEDELGSGNPPSTLVNFGAALQALAGDDRRRHGALLPLTRAAWQLEAELSESLGATQSADAALVDLYARCMHNLGVVKASLASGDGAASGPHDLAQAHVVASGLLGDAHNTTAALRESLQSAGSARGSRPRSRQSTLPSTPTPASAAAAAGAGGTTTATQTGSVPSRTPTPLGKTRPPVAPVAAAGGATRGGAEKGKEKEKEGGWQLPDIPMSAEEQAVAAAMQRRRH